MLRHHLVLNSALILLLTLSAGQALSCGLHEDRSPREISFVPGNGDRVLNMQMSTEKNGITGVTEDDTGFLGSYEMVKVLTMDIRPNEKGEVPPGDYKDQFEFLNERTGKLYLVFSGAGDIQGRKEILESIAKLNLIGKGAFAYKQEEIAQAWRNVVKNLSENGHAVTAKFKKSPTDSFGPEEDLNLHEYYGVIRTRCAGPRTTLNISQRFGKAGNSTGEKSAQ